MVSRRGVAGLDFDNRVRSLINTFGLVSVLLVLFPYMFNVISSFLIYVWEIVLIKSLCYFCLQFLLLRFSCYHFLDKGICFQGIFLVSVTRSGCLMVHDFESLYCQSKLGPGEALIYAHFLRVSFFKKLFFCL